MLNCFCRDVLRGEKVSVWLEKEQRGVEAYSAVSLSSLRFSSRDIPRSHTCTVPLSLLTHTAPPSFRNAIPKISAESVPRLSSLTRELVWGSQIRTSVPFEEAVAIKEPEGVVEMAERAEVWARMMETEG